MSTDNRYQYKKFITEFIELYKQHPTLWNLKCTEYNDRTAKHEAYMRLVEKLREVAPRCDKHDVIKKINSLRSAFRREYRKVVRMTACGKLYKPMLWYYDLISFTATDNDAKLKDTDRMNSDNGTAVDPLMVPLVKEEDENCADYDYEAEDNKLMNFTEDEPSGQYLTTHTEDEFDAIGRNVAFKLRSMERQQRVIAERIIAETLFLGQMGTLSVNSSSSDFTPTVNSK